MYADENVIKIKHAVLLEVAKAAFAGNLDEIRDDIPIYTDSGTDTSVPLLYLQGERDHPSTCQTCRG